MISPGSVSRWVGALKAGNNQAAQALWERYFAQLVAAARKLLRTPCGSGDEEDVALSAFASFCEGVVADRFPQLQDRDDLWKILVRITANKATDLIRHENRRKRGGSGTGDGSEGAVREEVVDWGQVVGDEPTPELVVQMAEEYERLLNMLDASMRSIAVLKLEGHTTAEIAEHLGCAGRTVERKLRVIRSVWQPNQQEPGN